MGIHLQTYRDEIHKLAQKMIPCALWRIPEIKDVEIAVIIDGSRLIPYLLDITFDGEYFHYAQIEDFNKIKKAYNIPDNIKHIVAIRDYLKPRGLYDILLHEFIHVKQEINGKPFDYDKPYSERWQEIEAYEFCADTFGDLRDDEEDFLLTYKTKR